MADIIQQVEEASIVKLVNGIIRMAVAKRASDIHINPEQRSTVISYRIDGILRQEKVIDEYIHPILISRIKIMGNMNIAEKRLPQDGRARLRVGEKLVDLRISSLPTIWGESIVIRVLEKRSTGEIRSPARVDGMRTMAETALRKAKEGITSVEQVSTNLIE